MSERVLRPADPDYWDQEFYIDGEGKGQVYEWYTGFEAVQEHVKEHIKEGQTILHVGAGNSTLAECILASKEFPSDLKFINADISQNIIDRMNERLTKIWEYFEETKGGRRSGAVKGKGKQPEEIRELVEVLEGGRRFEPSQISYVVADVGDMPEYMDESFDLVLDKGLLDAALSHGEVERGDDPTVQKILRELHRVLRNQGKYLIVSGNDSFITMPYFVGDEEVEWEVADPISISCQRQKGNKTSRTVFFYVLTAVK